MDDDPLDEVGAACHEWGAETSAARHLLGYPMKGDGGVVRTGGIGMGEEVCDFFAHEREMFFGFSV